MAICLSFGLSHKKSNHGGTGTCGFSSSSRSVVLFESLSVFFFFFSEPVTRSFSHSQGSPPPLLCPMHSTHVFAWEARQHQSNLHSASQPAGGSESASGKASETCQQSVAYFCVCEGACVRVCVCLSLNIYRLRSLWRNKQ